MTLKRFNIVSGTPSLHTSECESDFASFSRLLNRLPPTERGRRPFMNDLQAELHPMEILHDVKKLLTVSHVRISISQTIAYFHINAKSKILATTDLSIFREDCTSF